MQCTTYVFGIKSRICPLVVLDPRGIAENISDVRERWYHECVIIAEVEE